MAERVNGVEVDNPVLADYTKNAIRLHWDNEKICRVIGVPPEVVDHYKKEVEREDSGEQHKRTDAEKREVMEKRGPGRPRKEW